MGGVIKIKWFMVTQLFYSKVNLVTFATFFCCPMLIDVTQILVLGLSAQIKMSFA